jgi:cellulose synthase (UDP-forming)
VKVDPRLAEADRPAVINGVDASRRVRALLLVNIALAAWYFLWLLHPDRVGHPVLYGLLVGAEIFNLVQAAGFWWTCVAARDRPRRAPTQSLAVDVLIPTYNEPPDVVEPTLAAACRLRWPEVRVALLDDGGRPEMGALAARYGAAYITRESNAGAKAGNINNALSLTYAPYVAVFDCDHVPDERFLEATLGPLEDEDVAFVQTPQYYANADRGVAAASWAQQALFFGPIARGKDGLDAMFCCGTNVVFRRAALEAVGGFPQESVTEDFELSLRLHEAGWRTVYVPDVLARGLAPEDMGSYVTQQFRWARGCVSSIPRILRARLPMRVRVQYLLSSMFFMSGWTLVVYMAMPVIRLLTGDQPIEATTANTFLLHFAPYFLAAISTVAVAGGGAYTFEAFALVAATWWIHVAACVAALLGRAGRFKVTPKQGAAGRQTAVMLPTLVTIGILLTAVLWGLERDHGPATLNNVGFAALHIAVLLRGAWPALEGERG